MSIIVHQDHLPTGEEIVIRYPEEGDTQVFLDFINQISKEETFVLFQGKELTFNEENKFVEDVLKRIDEKKQIFLSLWIDGKLAGNSGIEMKSDAIAHEGLFGIVLGVEYREKGLGKLLMNTVISEAEKEIPNLRIISLTVFEENKIGRELYKKLGFKEYGWLPEGVFRKGKYDDHIFMYKKIK